MKTLTYEKDVLSSRLRVELLDAGVADTWEEETTWTEVAFDQVGDQMIPRDVEQSGMAQFRLVIGVIDPVDVIDDGEHIPTGEPSRVDITVADDQDEAVVSKVVDAHDPTPEPPPPPTIEQALAAALADIDPAKITATDPLSQAIKAALTASRV